MAGIPGASRHRLTSFNYLSAEDRQALTQKGLKPFAAPHPKQEFEKYLKRFDALEQRGVEVDKTGSLPDSPFRLLHLPATGKNPFKALITGAIHGDERGSPAAALMMFEWLLSDRALRERVELTVVPFVNPVGFMNDTRENGHGIDLNRSVFETGSEPRGGSTPFEIRRLKKSLEGRSFHRAFDLHGADSVEEGLFAICDEPGGTPGKVSAPVAKCTGAALDDLAKRVPLASKSLEVYQLVRPGLFTTGERGTLQRYLGSAHAEVAFTVEAPHVMSYRQRAKGLTAVMQAEITQALGFR